MTFSSPLFEWLVDGAPGAAGLTDVLARLGLDLNGEGAPVARIAAFVRTLHPHLMGSRYTWRRGREGVEVSNASYATLRSPEFLGSPVARVYANAAGFRRRLDGSEPFDHADFHSLRASGMTDYLVEPLHFLDGQIHAITFATDAPEGFTAEQIGRIQQVARPLARIVEILALRRTATDLLSAYVGRDAGERILKGQIQRGDVEEIRCVVWFSDLRGFTRMSAQKEPPAIIAILNRLFDCQIPAVERAGGQVLKFMGDGMLAIFPIQNSEEATAVAGRALAAANEAFSALDETNQRSPEAPMAFGIALHVGEVAYGNIGGVGRLDFTCIGAAVNLAARIEGLTAPTGKRLLLSAALAELVPEQTRSVGSFVLKGVEGAAEVFEPGPPEGWGPGGIGSRR